METFLKNASAFAKRCVEALEARSAIMTFKGQATIRTRCVVHDGEKPNSLVIFPAGNAYCHSRCGSLSRQQLAEALSIELRPEQLTVEKLAEAMALSEEFLRSEGGLTNKRGGGVWMPVLDESRKPLYRRERAALDGAFKFRQPAGQPTHAYGLWYLDGLHRGSDVLVVEGESDCWCLWNAGAPAVGLPGATQKAGIVGLASKLEERGLRPIVCRESDTAGGLFALMWAEAFPEARVITLTQDRGDWRDRWLASDGRDEFRTEINALKAGAEPIRVVLDGELRERIESARVLAEPFLTKDGLWNRLTELVSRSYVGDPGPSLLAYLASLSALLPIRKGDPTSLPLRIGFEGPATAGKTAAVEAGTQFIPDEGKAEFKATSEKTFIYSPRSFENKCFLMMEADSLPEDGPGASAFRSMCDGAGADYEVVITDPATGEYTTRRILKPGPTAIVTTSTKEHLAQMASRLMPVGCDASPQQTKRVVYHQAALAEGQVLETDPEPLHAAYVWLDLAGTSEVIVPFAQRVLDVINPAAYHAERIRRDFPQFISTVRTIAFLHQCQREKDSRGRIVADVRDYEIAIRLLGKTFSTTTSDGVTDSTRTVIKAVNALAPNHEGGVPTSVVVTQLSGIVGKSQVNAHLKRADAKGYLHNLTPGRGRRGHWLPDAPLPEKTLLPAPEEVFSISSGGIGPESREVLESQLQMAVVSDLPARFGVTPTGEQSNMGEPDPNSTKGVL